MAEIKKRGLGKGLEALLSSTANLTKKEEETPRKEKTEEIVYLDPREIDPNPNQPRIVFNEEALQELAESIRKDGVQEPVIVRRVGERYQLVTGERRVRAAIMADLATIPAIIRDVADADMLRLGLIENIQREDLNAIELAKAYQRLLDEFKWTQEELAQQVGKSRVSVTNFLRLLNLPEDVQQHLAEGRITMGHARALLALPGPEAQRNACRKIIEKGLSVRATEQLATPRRSKVKPPKDPHLVTIEEELRRRVGTKVIVSSRGKNRGVLAFEYYSLDDLDRILSFFRR